MSETLQDVSETEEQKIRNDIDVWLITTNAVSSGSMLHIPDTDGDPHCVERFPNCDFRDADVKAYPPGYRDICDYCAKHWRDQNE